MAAARTLRLQPVSALVLALLAAAAAPAAAQSTHEARHWYGQFYTFDRQRVAGYPEIAGNFKETADGDTSSNPPRPKMQRFTDVPPSNVLDADLPKLSGTPAGRRPGAAPKVYGYDGANGAYTLGLPTAKPPGSAHLAAKGTPDSAPYHRPKSFQIVSPGRNR